MPAIKISKALKRLKRAARYGFGAQAREREKAVEARAREQRFRQSGMWAHERDLTRRTYASYDEYVAHQTTKLETIVERLRRTEDEDLAVFVERFGNCRPLREARSVLCLGARLGTEVKALHRLGHFAIGVDLEPGPDNAYVLPGDFHDVVFPDESVDAIYTNALDHVFDLEQVVREIVRVLHPGGLFVSDLELGFDEGFIPGDFEAIHWRRREALLDRLMAMTGFALESADGLARQDRWTQVVLRKPWRWRAAADAAPQWLAAANLKAGTGGG